MRTLTPTQGRSSLRSHLVLSLGFDKVIKSVQLNATTLAEKMVVAILQPITISEGIDI
jgi:hypothetical protein